MRKTGPMTRKEAWYTVRPIRSVVFVMINLLSESICSNLVLKSDKPAYSLEVRESGKAVGIGDSGSDCLDTNLEIRWERPSK